MMTKPKFRCWRPSEGGPEEGHDVEALDAEDAAAEYVEKLVDNSGGDLLRDDPHRTFIVAVKGDSDQVEHFEVRPEYTVCYWPRPIEVAPKAESSP